MGGWLIYARILIVLEAHYTELTVALFAEKPMWCLMREVITSVARTRVLPVRNDRKDGQKLMRPSLRLRAATTRTLGESCCRPNHESRKRSGKWELFEVLAVL